MEVAMFKIIKKENLAPNIYLMDVVAPRIARYALPGQFLIVRLSVWLLWKSGTALPIWSALSADLLI